MNIAPKSSTPNSGTPPSTGNNNPQPGGLNQPKPAATHEAAHLNQPKKSFEFQSLGQGGQSQPSTNLKGQDAVDQKMQGSGSAFKPPGGSPPGSTPPGTPPGAASAGNTPPLPKKTGSKSKKTTILLVFAFIFMLISGAGLFYITQILPETEVPTDPVSEPEAIAPVVTMTPQPSPTPATCTLSFAIDTPDEEVTPTVTPDPSVTPTITPTGTPGPTATPTEEPEPTNTPAPGEPTNTPAPGEPTNTPAPAAPTNTPAPAQPTQATTQVVDTRANCNEPCSTNADCRNISHICYNSRCRLDVNPEDELCRTPAGETTVERPVEQPVAGFSDWIDFLRIGIGAIGAGLLLLLFL